jgi:hypothetical protein
MNMRDDDEKFEQFLRQFRPRAPQPLPIEKQERASKLRFVFVGSAAVAAVILAVALIVYFQPNTADNTKDLAVKPLTDPQELTIGSANALLAQKPSLKAVVDEMAFKSQSTPPSKGMQSALAVLSKENIKL